MTLKRPLLMQPAGGDPAIQYSALDVRALLGMLLRNSGILHALPPGATALQVTQRAAGANFSVDVNLGAAVISGSDVSGQGMYAVESTAVENLVVPTPPVSGTRIHRVIARVRDKLHNGALTTYDWVLEVLPDVGSGTPATPASAISLATVSVTVGQASVLTANIVDTRVVALLGPSRPSNVNASNRPQNPFTGEFVYRTDIADLEIYNGTAWVAFGIGKNVFARKTANESLAGNTSLGNDTHLFVPVAANTTYKMTAVLKYEASTTGDLKFQWTGPAGAALVAAISALISTAASDLDDFIILDELATSKVAGGRGAGTPRAVQWSGLLVTGGTAGTFRLQWAQNTSDATATILFANSFVALERVA